MPFSVGGRHAERACYEGRPRANLAWAVVIVAGLMASAASAQAISGKVDRPRIIEVDADNPQAAIDAAPPHSTLAFDRNRQLVLSQPLKIGKSLTIRGLNARLPDRLGKTPLVVVQAEGVVVSDFELHGNGDTVPQSQRASLLVLEAGNFTVERGLFTNTSKDGILIDGTAVRTGDLVGGVVRDIVGRTIRRDLVSVSGSGNSRHRIRHVLIDNVRCHGSELRGAVEVSDGSDNITVRKVFAEDCVYAIDVQDHGEPDQVNTNVLIQDVLARNCRHALRTANRALGHAHLTIRDVIAERCVAPLQVSNTSDVAIANILAVDHDSARPPIAITNCNGLAMRDLTVKNTRHAGPAILVENCHGVLVDGVSLRGPAPSLTAILNVRITRDEAFSGLRVSHVLGNAGQDLGIVLERKGSAGSLSDYVISGNCVRVVDRIQGPRGVVEANTGP